MNYTKLASLSRSASIVLLVVLVAYLAIHHILRGQDVVFRLLVSCVPLLGFLPGLIAAKFRSGSWLCFVLLLYFIAFVEALGVPGNSWGEAFALFLTVSLFISAMMFARWQQRADADIAFGEPSND